MDRRKIVAYSVIDKMGGSKVRCKGQQKPVKFKIITRPNSDKLDLRVLLLACGQTSFYRGQPYYFYSSSTELPKPTDARVWSAKRESERDLWLYASDNLLALKRAVAPYAENQFGAEGANFGHATILRLIIEKDELDELISDLLK